jgi:hypothetical protein
VAGRISDLESKTNFRYDKDPAFNDKQAREISQRYCRWIFGLKSAIIRTSTILFVKKDPDPERKPYQKLLLGISKPRFTKTFLWSVAFLPFFCGASKKKKFRKIRKNLRQ